MDSYQSTDVSAFITPSGWAALDKSCLLVEWMRWMGQPAIWPATFAISAGPSIAPIAATIPAPKIVDARDRHRVELPADFA